jgi:hypothetical protein
MVKNLVKFLILQKIINPWECDTPLGLSNNIIMVKKALLKFNFVTKFKPKVCFLIAKKKDNVVAPRVSK